MRDEGFAAFWTIAGRVATMGDSCNMGAKVDGCDGFWEREPTTGWFDLTSGGALFFIGYSVKICICRWLEGSRRW
jgi:hypothetical protein